MNNFDMIYPFYDFREILNGVWFILNVSLMIVFVRFIIVRRKEDPEWYHDWNVKGAVGLAVYFSGSALLRFWVWTTLMLDNQGDELAFIRGRVEIAIIAAVIAISGALCAIRVYTPRHWPHLVWIIIGVFAVTIPMIVHHIYN